MNQHEKVMGKGIIAHDEVHGSSDGSNASGERGLLCTLWSGDCHTVNYTLKYRVKIPSSSLCLGGFMQPEKLMQEWGPSRMASWTG